METITKRKYVKNYNVKQEEGFIYYGSIDFHNIKKITDLHSFQPCEDREHLNKNFNNVIYFWRNEYHLLNFDFKNSKVSINGKTFKIIPDYEFTYKKTRGNNILAIGGIEGFYSFIVTSMEPDSAFCSYTFNAIKSISKTLPKEIPQ